MARYCACRILRAENCGSSTVAVLDKVVDVFFVQFIGGVDVPVIMQRHGLLSVLGKVVDMPVVFNDRCSWRRMLSMSLLLQFIDKVCSPCDLAGSRDSLVQFWMFVDMPVGVQTTGFGQTVKKNYGSAVAFF